MPPASLLGKAAEPEVAPRFCKKLTCVDFDTSHCMLQSGAHRTVYNATVGEMRPCFQGFPARVRPAEEDLTGEAEKADQRRSEELRQSILNLGVAWSLALLCCTHHVGHWLHALGFHSMAHGAMMNMMSNPWVSGMLGAFALLGPGRTLIKDGAVSLYR